MKQAPMAAALAIAALAGGAGMASAQAFSLGERLRQGFRRRDLAVELRHDPQRRTESRSPVPSFDYDTGYTLGVAVGAAFTPNISIEIEYAYRSADFTVTTGRR